MKRLRFTKDAAGNIYLGGQPIEDAYAQRREYVDATERDEELIELHRTIARLRKGMQDMDDTFAEVKIGLRLMAIDWLLDPDEGDPAFPKPSVEELVERYRDKGRKAVAELDTPINRKTIPQEEQP